MDQENIMRTPTKYFQMENSPAGLTNYKKSYLFTPVKESTVMEPEGNISMRTFGEADLECR